DHGDSSWRVVPAIVQVPAGVVLDAVEERDEDPDTHAWADVEPLSSIKPPAPAPAPEPAPAESESESESTAAPELAAIVEPAEVEQLARRLGEAPLAEPLRERLSYWLMAGAG